MIIYVSVHVCLQYTLPTTYLANEEDGMPSTALREIALLKVPHGSTTTEQFFNSSPCNKIGYLDVPGRKLAIKWLGSMG